MIWKIIEYTLLTAVVIIGVGFLGLIGFAFFLKIVDFDPS